MDLRLNHGQPPFIPGGANVMWFDVVGEDVGVNRGAAVGLVGDVGLSMRQLTEATKQPGEGAWLEYIRREERNALGRDGALMSSDTVPVHPMRFCRAIRGFIDEETTAVGDGGAIV